MDGRRGENDMMYNNAYIFYYIVFYKYVFFQVKKNFDNLIGDHDQRPHFISLYSSVDTFLLSPVCLESCVLTVISRHFHLQSQSLTFLSQLTYRVACRVQTGAGDWRQLKCIKWWKPFLLILFSIPHILLKVLKYLSN